jgi:hypothetical protein
MLLFFVLHVDVVAAVLAYVVLVFSVVSVGYCYAQLNNTGKNN